MSLAGCYFAIRVAKPRIVSHFDVDVQTGFVIHVGDTPSSAVTEVQPRVFSSSTSTSVDNWVINDDVISYDSGCELDCDSPVARLSQWDPTLSPSDSVSTYRTYDLLKSKSTQTLFSPDGSQQSDNKINSSALAEKEKPSSRIIPKIICTPPQDCFRKSHKESRSSTFSKNPVVRKNGKKLKKWEPDTVSNSDLEEYLSSRTLEVEDCQWRRWRSLNFDRNSEAENVIFQKKSPIKVVVTKRKEMMKTAGYTGHILTNKKPDQATHFKGKPTLQKMQSKPKMLISKIKHREKKPNVFRDLTFIGYNPMSFLKHSVSLLSFSM